MKRMPGSNNVNPFAQLVEDADGLDKIEQLQEHQNEDLYEKAVSILETYFECEEGDDQNLAPQLAGNQYAFGQPAPQPGGFNFDGAAGQQGGAPGGAFNFQGFGK